MSESEFLYHTSCDACGSSDANAVYSDGHTFCHNCRAYVTDNEAVDVRSERPRSKSNGLLNSGDFVEWNSRGLTEASCRKWGIHRVSDYNGQAARVFNHYSPSRDLVAQKIRFRDKRDGMPIKGEISKAGLYGQHLWRDAGKKIVIVEGEIDAVSLSQVQNHKWPVVSVKTGAQGAHKDLKKSLDWLMNFEEVILMFDMDNPGREAAQKCSELFQPGQCKIASLPLKDPNEMLVAGREKELINAIWDAKEYRPDGVIDGRDLYNDVMDDDTDFEESSYHFEKLQEVTQGSRPGEIVTFTAGTGIGKSAIMREVAYDKIQKGDPVGILMLEENTKRTGRGLMGLAVDVPLHLRKPSEVTQEVRERAYANTLGTGLVYLYDHFGSTGIDNLLSKIRFMAKALGCKWIFLDHLSIIISGHEDGDERRLIDNTMTALKALAMECNVGIFLVCHLRRSDGDKGHEQGAKTSLTQLRGSHAIAQLSDFVIGLERNQQDEDLKHYTTLRVLKNRWTGETGVAGWLEYKPHTGRLVEVFEDPTEKKTNELDGDEEF